MELYKFFPTPSDRMGTLWTLASIEEAYIIEFGPAGTTHFAIEGMMQLNGEHKANTYTTHIDETDISFGSQERLEKAILEIDNQHNPKVIFVMASSISSIIGTDIQSVCFEMESRVKAKLIPITTGGFSGDYALGVENTLALLCKEVVQPTEYKKSKSYNIIGNSMDTFNFLSDVEEVTTIMREVFGVSEHAVFTAYTSIDIIEDAAEAEFNLVLRGEGIKAAEILKNDYEMDFYYGRPYGLQGTIDWIKGIEEKLNLKADEMYIGKKVSQIRRHLMSYKMMTRQMENKSVVLVGDYDVVVGMAQLVEELGLNVSRIIVKHKASKKVKGLILEKYKDIMDFELSENEIEAYLKDTPIYLLLADGATLKLEHQSEIKMQITNPNFVKHTIYPYTPFVGFNGMMYVVQCLIELEKERNS